ncbi:uncharacterized protein LOC127239217 [Andrographis paniculata]|uniref:uncharacterized protein LOC127239217 n=1 Tax=Andrographis paniculata TaxID=175694 RepID=UPI0021E8F387|nr:uncharacterized protein LOC127239217 [Andrographis paniculata]
MASLNVFFSPIVIQQKRVRVIRTAATATKAGGGGGGGSGEKGLLDFILGGLTKDDQFFETDPILKKVEEKSGTAGVRKVEAPPQKKKDAGGGFGLGLGGLFSKK